MSTKHGNKALNQDDLVVWVVGVAIVNRPKPGIQIQNLLMLTLGSSLDWTLPVPDTALRWLKER